MDYHLDSYKGLAINIGITAFAHPALYVKTLIQIGHEPIAPRFTKGFIGANYYTYPHLFKYIGHIHKVDGFGGIYRGITPHLMSIVARTYLTPAFKKVLSVAGLRYSYEKVTAAAPANTEANTSLNTAKVQQQSNDETNVEQNAEIQEGEEEKSTLQLDPMLSDKVTAAAPAHTEAKAQKQSNDEIQEEEEEEEKSTLQLITSMLSDTFLEVCVRSFTIIFSQPFQVIMIRQMAEFVGGESIYGMGIMASIREIYHTEGIMGFFSGIAPLLLSEAVLVASSNVTMFTFLNLVIPQIESITSFGEYFENQGNLKSQVPIIHVLTGLAFSSYLYKYKMISNVMIVKDSGLLAGRNLGMESCLGWHDCLNHLGKEEQYKRGASLFLRTVPKSHLIAHGII